MQCILTSTSFSSVTNELHVESFTTMTLVWTFIIRTYLITSSIIHQALVHVYKQEMKQSMEYTHVEVNNEL